MIIEYDIRLFSHGERIKIGMFREEGDVTKGGWNSNFNAFFFRDLAKNIIGREYIDWNLPHYSFYLFSSGINFRLAQIKQLMKKIDIYGFPGFGEIGPYHVWELNGVLDNAIQFIRTEPKWASLCSGTYMLDSFQLAVDEGVQRYIFAEWHHHEEKVRGLLSYAIIEINKQKSKDNAYVIILCRREGGLRGHELFSFITQFLRDIRIKTVELAAVQRAREFWYTQGFDVDRDSDMFSEEEEEEPEDGIGLVPMILHLDRVSPEGLKNIQEHRIQLIKKKQATEKQENEKWLKKLSDRARQAALTRARRHFCKKMKSTPTVRSVPY